MSKRDPGLSAHVGRRPAPRNQSGFTLIELLVVITILGVLAGVVVFSVRGIGDKGQAAATKIDERTLRTAQEAYCAKFGSYGSESALVGAQLLSEKSTLSNIRLGSDGTCGTGPNSSFTIGTAPTAGIRIAANADQWVVNDAGSGPGYDSSSFVYPLNSNMMEPLIIIGSDYTLKQGLALEWVRIPTGTTRSPQPAVHSPYTNAPDRPYNNDTWRMKLRPGVVFQDGSTFDATDVIWTWRDRQPINGAPLTTVTNTLGFTHQRKATATDPIDAFDSVEYIDALTVDFTPRIANLRLPEQIGHPKGAILPATGPAGFADVPGLSIPRQAGRHNDGSTGGLPAGTVVFGSTTSPGATDPTAGTPTGTGPFRHDTYEVNRSATTKVFDGYWGASPQVASMTYTFLPDTTQRTSGLRSGQFDFAIDLNPLDVSSVEAAGLTVKTASYGQNALIYVNQVVKDSPAAPVGTAAPPGTPASYRFNLGTDPAIRKAVSLAMNRADIVSSVYDGRADPGRWMAPPNILGTFQNLVPPLSFSRAQAASGLAAAGWTCPAGDDGTKCAGGAARVHSTDGGPYSARALKLVLIGGPDFSQLGYDLLTSQMAEVGIDLKAIRANCNTFALPATACAGGGPSRSQMYGTSLWDLDLEIPNQNDANPAFLPVLRMSCLPSNAGFRFAPVDGTRGVGPPVTDTTAQGGGTFPLGNTPCTSPGVVLGPMDNTFAPNSNTATTQAGAQEAAANQMRILVNQNETNVVIPVAGQFRIYGVKPTFSFGDPHPSQTSQRWDSLSFVGA